MDEYTFLQTAQMFVDPVAVIFAITASQLLKSWFFTDKATDTKTLLPGTLWNRIFPSVPILLACFYVIALNYKIYNINVLINKGIVSGAMAGFFFRTWKVAVGGE